jgi:ATP-binding cassette subfamily B protein
MASTTRALDLLDTETKIISGDKSINGPDTQGEIVVKNVTFNYKSRDSVLQNLDFKIESGQTVGFVGATGAGKSTILKLLLRFYDPTEGSVIFDGTDIREFDLNDYRKVIGFVPQDAFLIDGTIRENILYGDPDAEMDAVIHAAKIAEIFDFIDELPQGFDTLVGERGQKLSGGQRQRISIARAILKNPPVLIFDEATSSVDNETEAAIQRSLEKITLDRTTILIAHRLSTIKHADTIYVLDSGKIIEQGTHDELLKSDSYYRTLWNVQTGKKVN